MSKTKSEVDGQPSFSIASASVAAIFALALTGNKLTPHVEDADEGNSDTDGNNNADLSANNAGAFSALMFPPFASSWAVA